jgi:DNA primase
VIEEVKVKVPVMDLAERLGAGQRYRSGADLIMNCPLPDHEDKTPSFAVNPETNLWFCFGCLRGGDVVELARFAWGYDQADCAMAAADVLEAFGYDPPQRRSAWYRKQERQASVRDAIAEVQIMSARRRIYRWLFVPILEAFIDPEERTEEAKRIWVATEPIARTLWARRHDGGRV